MRVNGPNLLSIEHLMNIVQLWDFVLPLSLPSLLSHFGSVFVVHSESSLLFLSIAMS